MKEDPYFFEMECSKRDFTSWLRDINEEDPVAWPKWPDCKDRLVIFVEAEDEQLSMVNVTSREAMIACMEPGRLWFCNVPVDAFLEYASIVDIHKV